MRIGLVQTDINGAKGSKTKIAKLFVGAASNRGFWPNKKADQFGRLFLPDTVILLQRASCVS